jgi:hypothetical protein
MESGTSKNASLSTTMETSSASDNDLLFVIGKMSQLGFALIKKQ